MSKATTTRPKRGSTALARLRAQNQELTRELGAARRGWRKAQRAAEQASEACIAQRGRNAELRELLDEIRKELTGNGVSKPAPAVVPAARVEHESEGHKE